MLASISESLADQGLSVESLVTDVQQSKHNDTPDFVVNVDCITSAHMDQDALKDMVADLGALKTTLDLDLVDVRVQRMVQQQSNE